jgi:hypothetical protein
VAGGITDSPTAALIRGTRFDKFFSGLNAYFYARLHDDKAIHFVPPSFAAILKNINRGLLQNTPQIRFPGTRGYFAAVDFDNTLSILSYAKLLEIELRAKAKHEKAELSIGKDIEALLLYPGILRIPLHLDDRAEKFNEQKLPKIISMIPGDGVHYLEELKIDSGFIKDLERALRSIFAGVTPERQSFKAFLVKKLIFNGDDLGSIMITTNYSKDKSYLTIRLYKFDENDYTHLKKREYNFDKNEFIDVENHQLLSVLINLVEKMPSNEVLYQSSGGRETKANFKRIFNLFFPFKKIIDSMIQSNQMAELEKIFDLAIEQNWQDVINIFKRYPHFEALYRTRHLH